VSNNRLEFVGLAELKAELRKLPTELVNEARQIVLVAVEEAADDIRDGYPRRTGDLKDKVKTTHEHTAFGAIGKVKNTSKHALPFEVGTQARHTALGANRGSMPPGNVFRPAIAKKKREMYEGLKALLERHGLQVSGDAG
jgi:hypothetical protein